MSAAAPLRRSQSEFGAPCRLARRGRPCHPGGDEGNDKHDDHGGEKEKKKKKKKARRKLDLHKTPQERLNAFWGTFHSSKTGMVTSILPQALRANLTLPFQHARGHRPARNAAESYETAARECREKVKRIVQECNRVNEKFTDPDFDIADEAAANCLYGLVRDDNESDTESGGEDSGDNDDDDDDDDESYEYSDDADNDDSIDNQHLSSMRRRACRQRSGLRFDGRGRSARPRSRIGRATPSEKKLDPGSVHRVDWIFNSPQFVKKGYTLEDIKQGAIGNCWWLTALSLIVHRRDLMDKICVARDEEVGVYGFVFYRDGEWISTVVDDNLYLEKVDFDYRGNHYDPTGKRAREHKQRWQTGSEALYFSHCADENTTWLPLLEKAYAKIHGDYYALDWGWSGPAAEDLTGGVSGGFESSSVLRKEKLWKQLMNQDGDFVFSMILSQHGQEDIKEGLTTGHSYSIIGAVEETDDDGNRIRLVRVLNPWGQKHPVDGHGEWNGPWSDGSKEWTPGMLKRLNHTFGDNGQFYISFEDMLKTFQWIERTRLFDHRWTVVQQWTSVNIGWMGGFLKSKFVVDIKKGGTVVFLLCKPDGRYFRGLEGQYQFLLQFRVQKEGAKPDEYICQSPKTPSTFRSTSCEVDLEAGRYEIIPFVEAIRFKDRLLVEEVVRDMATKRPRKLRQVGLQYDYAHAKAGIPDEDSLIRARRRAIQAAERKKKTDEASEKTDDKEVHGSKEREKKTDDKMAENKEDHNSKISGDNGQDRHECAEEHPAETESEKSSSGGPGTPNTAEDLEMHALRIHSDDENEDEEKDTASDDEKREKRPEQETLTRDKNDSSRGKTDEEEAPKKEQKLSKRLQWNAVCVLGLRCHAQDPDITISAVTPSNETGIKEEAVGNRDKV